MNYNIDCSKYISAPSKDFRKAVKTLKAANIPGPYMAVQSPIELGNCPTATTACTPISGYKEQKQGNNPMRVTETSATVSVAAAVSDESKQRDYLLSELDETVRYSWNDPKYAALRKQFNIDTPKVPETSQEILDAFSTGAFTVDQKKVDSATKWAKRYESDDDFDDEYEGQSSRFYGITFTGMPVADRKGYDAAVAAYDKAKKDTKRAIIVGSPADGLAALISLETWAPATGTVAS